MPLISQDLRGIANFILSPECRSICVLTGAGISCAAGIPDFRSPGGMYSTLRPELITATASQRAAMAADPVSVVERSMFLSNPFPYLEVRRPFILGTQEQRWRATLSHRFVELLHTKAGKLTRLYTQNIDGLDFQTSLPAELIVPVHGSMGSVACEVRPLRGPVHQPLGSWSQPHIRPRPSFPVLRRPGAVGRVLRQRAIQHQGHLQARPESACKVDAHRVCFLWQVRARHQQRAAVWSLSYTGQRLSLTLKRSILILASDPVLLLHRPTVKPTTVLFGSSLPKRFFECAQVDLPGTDLLIISGTSLVVSPVRGARSRRATHPRHLQRNPNTVSRFALHIGRPLGACRQQAPGPAAAPHLACKRPTE